MVGRADDEPSHADARTVEDARKAESARKAADAPTLNLLLLLLLPLISSLHPL